MNRLVALFWMLICQAAWAHHTKDHLMLTEDAEQVIAATREGNATGWLWLLVGLLLIVGLWRWRRRR
jgi:hypothetical protein